MPRKKLGSSGVEADHCCTDKALCSDGGVDLAILRPCDMEMKDHFVAMPRAGRCELIFSRVDQSLMEQNF